MSDLHPNPGTWGLSRVDALLWGVAVTTVPRHSQWSPGSSWVPHSGQSLLLQRLPELRFAVCPLLRATGCSLVPGAGLLSLFLPFSSIVSW